MRSLSPAFLTCFRLRTVFVIPLQSDVCMKLLALDLIELLLLTLFPELEYVFKPFHEEKEKFGKIDIHD